MYKKIKVKNFKSLKDINLKLSNLNLFTGVNSSGKSSVIQTLLLIKQNFENKLIILDELSRKMNITVEELLVVLLSSLRINTDYLNLGNASNILYENATEDQMLIQIELENGLVDFDCNNFRENKDQETIDCKLSFQGKISELLVNNNFSYLSADRIIPQSFYKYSKENIIKGNLGKNGEYTVHYLAEYKNKDIFIQSLKHENASSFQLLENASSWLSKISKGIDVKPEANLIQQSSTLKYSYGTKVILPQNVGFGITYILPIIVAILKSKPGDTLIIENPESHLHPAGQVEIAKLCAKAAEAGVQLIIKSHSDHFLNGIRVAIKEKVISQNLIKVYYFSKNYDEDNISVIQEIEIDSNGKIECWPEGFFDEWEIQLEKLLW